MIAKLYVFYQEDMIRLSRKRFLVFYFIIIFFWLKSNRTKEIAGIGKSPVPLATRMCLNVILPVLWRKTFWKILKHEVFSVPCYSVKIFFFNSCISFWRFFFTKSRVLFAIFSSPVYLFLCDTMVLFEYFPVHTAMCSSRKYFCGMKLFIFPIEISLLKYYRLLLLF